MNLWIRSQDREKIICCNDIAIATDNEYKIYKIVGYFDKNTEYEDLGFYLTKERALEVLDEIDKYKNKLEKAHFLGMEESEFVSSTFQMPKEW